MKIRQGFVSNSSSCSFVVIGFEIAYDFDTLKNIYLDILNGTEEEIEKEMKEWKLKPFDAIRELIYDKFDCHGSGYRILNGSDDGVGNRTVFGKEIAEGDDLDSARIPLTSLMREINEIQEKIGCNSEINIYTGTRCC